MTSIQPLVTIITPVYNGAKYIEELILSVKEQDYPNIEHIIIDDGSTDDGATLDILKKYPHLRWWNRPNKGQYATLNEGLDAAKGEVVCFVSADDVLENRAIRRAMEFIKTFPDCNGAYGFTAFMREDGTPYVPVTPFRYRPLKYYAYLWHVSHCSIYIKRSVLVKNELNFNATLRYAGDYDWIIRLINKGVKIKMLPETLSWVRVHDGQTSVQQRKKMRVERESIAIRHGINPLLYSFTLFATTWLFNFYKLFFTFKQTGIQGSHELIRNWWRKRDFPEK
jgi:glycosyltransferase involved in cell wall biosynthesis